jgi:DNA-binding IclR family transcriptional regulator
MLVTSARMGRRLPVHATALGKVLVAGEQERQAFDREVLSGPGVEALTPATLVDRDKLIEHLGAVAVRGWAADWEESSPGLCCAAAPVVAPSGRIVAALSVSAPSSRLTPESLEQHLAPAVLAAAEGLTRQIA